MVSDIAPWTGIRTSSDPNHHRERRSNEAPEKGVDVVGRDNRDQADDPADQQQPADINGDGDRRRDRRADRQHAQNDHDHALEQEQLPVGAESVRHGTLHIAQGRIHVRHAVSPVWSARVALGAGHVPT